MEVVLTHPAPQFTVNDIWQQVQEILPQPVRIDVINNYITYVWLKKGIIRKANKEGLYNLTYEGRPNLEKMLEKANKKSWKAPPTGRPRPKPLARPKLITPSEIQLSAQPPSSQDETIDTVMIGEAIIAKINDYQDKIKALQDTINKLVVGYKSKITDMGVTHKADVDAYKQIIRGKDSTITEFKRDIEALKKSNTIKRRTMPLSEIAIFKKDKS